MRVKESGIEVIDLYVSYNGFYVIEGASFTLKSPFYALLLGPNGAGKTTLLKTLIGLLRPSRGYVRVYGINPSSNMRALSRLVGYLPQPGTSRLGAFLKVKELVAMGYLSLKRPPRYIDRETARAVEESLKVMGIEGLAEKYLNELSGGQLRRAMIAGIIVRRPKLMVLDEPLASLDLDAKCDLVRALYELHWRTGVDVIMSTHELIPCALFEPMVILLNRRVYACGPAEKVLTKEILREVYPSMTEVAGLALLSEDHAVRR